MLFVEKFRNHSVKVNLVLLLDISFHLFLTHIAAILRVASEDILHFPIERGARQVSRPSFTVEIPMLSLVTALVSIGNILRY